ncbi:glycoside hydrolase family 44 protein [Streptomyces sp. NPDC092296]|uniref:glycoside hydrolase family 44 protein n=1 Tax=Streptomyces sp. NPDC092296 TaxID=3366012 RepID=UPI0037F394AC
MQRRSLALAVLITSALVSTGLAASPAVSAAAPRAAATYEPPVLSVDPAAGRHSISRDIYGMSFADAGLAKELKLPVDRWGGNATTRYNYLTDTSNRASDWYFENIPEDVADPSALPDGSSTDQFIEKDRAAGSDTIITVPLIGWVPKPEREKLCGFSVEKYGPQQSTDQWAPDCGNGLKPDGTPITGNDPTDTSVPAGADYVSDWVKYLDDTYGDAAHGGVKFYNLDNEPDIWHETHRDVHPKGATYDEIRDRTYEVAAAIKATDPAAKTLGPTGWGWNSITLSGADQQTCNTEGGSCWSNPPDKAAHGGVDFGAWYLQQMAAYEQDHGTRILDYYDNHWYPQGNGVFSESDDPDTQALRLRSTRGLWDPTYTDESWIGQPVMAIPRMKSLVDANYPGTKTAITEYNWGALDKIDGAAAEADILGIFGREGLDLANLWGPPNPDDPGAYAFRMYLNYDGAGSSFGDTAVKAASSDQDQLSVYAAERSSDRNLTVMVVNKTPDAVSSPLSIAGLTGTSKAKVYQYGQADTTAIQHLADQTVTNGSTAMSFPAYSITELVLPPASTPPASTCKVTYTAQSEWTGGVVVGVDIRNTGSTALNGWQLSWTFPGDQRVSNVWNATLTQTGQRVTATAMDYNARISPGGTASFGFQAAWTASDRPPTAFTLNGSPCTTG